MIIRKLKSIDHLKINVDSLVVDPHGELVGLWAHGQLQVVEVLTIMRYSEIWRLQFRKHYTYSTDMSLNSIITLTSVLPNKEVLCTLLSQKQQGIQYIAFVTLKVIEIVKLHIATRTIKNRQIFNLPFEIIDVNFIGLRLYVAMYNLSLTVVDLVTMDIHSQQSQKKVHTSVQGIMSHQTKQKLRKKEIMRFHEKDSATSKLWQTAEGYLMSDERIISTQFHQKLDFSNSYEEFQYRQIKEFSPIKYELSACRQYLIGSDTMKRILSKDSNVYIIRSKMTEWCQIAELSHRPQINPYFTFAYLYERQQKTNCSQRKVKQLDTLSIDRLLIASYNAEQRQISVSWIIVDLKRKKKLPQIDKDEKKQENIVKYESEVIKILTVKNIKHGVSLLKWIGLNQLLYLQEEGQLHFMQFQYRYLSY